MSGKTIFIGDIQDDLRISAQSYDSTAWLLTSHNSQRWISDQSASITVYTSLGDLCKDLCKVFDILCCADTIHYCKPINWSDGKNIDPMDPGSSLQGLTETLLHLLPSHIKVYGLELTSTQYHDPIPLVAGRLTDEPQLWIAGCSVSHGIGVQPQERYGHLIAHELDMCCSYLTRPGSALDWAANQILRSDVRPNDIVIWGLTDWNRLTHVHQHQLLKGVNAHSYQQFPSYKEIVGIHNLFSHQTFYNHFYSLHTVINFCKQIGARLLLIGILQGNHALLSFLRSQQNYVHIDYQLTYQDSMLGYQFVDLGTDSIHPGPQQHKAYSQAVLEFLHH